MPLDDWPYTWIYVHIKKVCPWIACFMPWRSEAKIDWPYRNLHEQLREDGLGYLANNIQCNVNYRTTPAFINCQDTFRPMNRHFMNRLKHRIELLYPEKYGPIAYTEAKVRLISAIWYACRPIWLISGTMFFVILIAVALHELDLLGEAHYGWHYEYLIASVVPLSIFLGTCYAEKIILDCYHQLRVREVYIILEIAYCLSVFDDDETPHKSEKLIARSL